MVHLFWLAIISGGFMAWAVGANDVANAMGTSVGSKIITIKQAILIAALFEGLGAMLSSGNVTGTIRNDIIDIHVYQDQMVLAQGMVAALFASATWLIIATTRGWPVSTTHSIVGALVGFGLVTEGADHIQWHNIASIGIHWVVTPIISGGISWFSFKLIQRFVLTHYNPLMRVSVFFSVMMAIGAFFASLLFSNFIFGHHEYLFALSVACTAALLSYGLNYSKSDQILSYREQIQRTEKVFGLLALCSACAMAYAHGANDVANAIGPMASVVDILQYGYIKQDSLPLWLVFLGSCGVVLGLAMYGYKIISSVGSKITTLSPSRSFSAQFATSIVVLVASYLGMPVSTTQTLVGAVLGVGLARGLAAVNLSVVLEIFMSWGVTLPIGGVFAILYYWLLGLIL
jgi:PiT family inorganic phosphate transporter